MARKGTTFEEVMERRLAEGGYIPTEIDWARLAAYLDGEGCIRIRRSKPKRPGLSMRYDLEVTITNTDARLIQWCHRNFDGGFFLNQVPSVDRRPCWYWRCRTRAAAYVVQKCLPYFIVKREQAELALAFEALNPSRRSYRWVPKEMTEKREELYRAMTMTKGAKVNLETAREVGYVQ